MSFIQKFFGNGIEPTADVRAPARYKQFEYDGKVLKSRLLPKLQAELDAKLLSAARDRDAKVDGSAGVRDKALKEAKAAYDARVSEIERENRQAQHKANVEFDEIEARLLAEYARPLTSEEVALLSTRPGEIVRMPRTGDGGSTGIVPAVAPQGA